jgi:putative oxidoreductase
MDFTSLGLLILRVAMSATLAIGHGLPKLFDFSNKLHTFPDPIGLGSPITLTLAVCSELLFPILVAIGIFTRIAAIPTVIMFAVAFFVFHGSDPFAKKELAFLYLIGFTSIMAAGPGRFSADAMVRGVK